MRRNPATALLGLALVFVALAHPPAALAQHEPAASIPATDLIQPAELAAVLHKPPAAKPVVLQVGSHVLYTQAHIPGSEYAGPGGEDSGLQLLRDRVANLPHDAAIVLYCGCCPWSRCPNVAAAYNQLRALGFTQVKVLYIAENFGANWVDAGYPVSKGG